MVAGAVVLDDARARFIDLLGEGSATVDCCLPTIRFKHTVVPLEWVRVILPDDER